MHPLRSYRQVQNETSSAEQRLVLLFEAAQRHMQAGAAALDGQAVPAALASLAKASDIVDELWSTLDHQRAPELCETLARVYQYVSLQLVSAVSARDPQRVRDAERAFAPLVDAFRQAVAQVGAGAR